jgi:hypothetical protein
MASAGYAARAYFDCLAALQEERAIPMAFPPATLGLLYVVRRLIF